MRYLPPGNLLRGVAVEVEEVERGGGGFMKRYTWLLALIVMLALWLAPNNALALAPCPPTAAPAPHTPSGVTTAKRPAFSWGAVPGATGYSLSVARMSDGAIILSRTNITATSFTPTSDLLTDVDLRWKVNAESSCGPGPASPSLFFKVSSTP